MKRLFFTVAMVVMMTGLASAQSDLQPIANVKLQKSEPITLKQLKSRVEAYQKELGRVMTIAERKQVLDTLINERLVVQAAEKDGVKVADSEVTQSFLKMIAQQVEQDVTEAEFAQLVKQKTGLSLDDYMRAQNGMSLVEYKTFLKSQLLAQRYVMSKKQAEIQAISPTDADIRSYYDLYKSNFVQADTVRIFLVVVPKKEVPADAKAKLVELQKQLKDKSVSTAELKIRSQAANSGYTAGDLYISKNATAASELGITMDALLKIFAMGMNDVSDVSETDTDFQCFVVQEKFPAKILELSDVVQPGTTVTVYEYIKTNMISQGQSKAINDALAVIINDLRKPENYQISKTDAELDKILAW